MVALVTQKVIGLIMGATYLGYRCSRGYLINYHNHHKDEFIIKVCQNVVVRIDCCRYMNDLSFGG